MPKFTHIFDVSPSENMHKSSPEYGPIFVILPVLQLNPADSLSKTYILRINLGHVTVKAPKMQADQERVAGSLDLNLSPHRKMRCSGKIETQKG